MKLKHIWLVGVFFFIFAVGFRSYQALYLIDPDTGFLPIGDYSIYILAAVLIIFTIILLFISAKCKNVPSSYIQKKNIPAGIFSLLTSALLFVDSFNKIWAYALVSYNSSDLILSLFSILGGTNFLLLAIGSFAGENIIKKIPFLSVGASLWACSRIVVSLFIYHYNTSGISYYTLNILGIVALAIFLFTQAKLLSGVTTNKTGKRCVYLAILSLVLMSVYLFPNMITKLSSNEPISFNNMLIDIIDILILLYILSFSIPLTILFKNTTKPTLQINDNLLSDDALAHNTEKNQAIKDNLKKKSTSNTEKNQAIKDDLKKKSTSNLDNPPIKRNEVSNYNTDTDNISNPNTSENSVDMSYIDDIINDIVSKN